MHDHEDDTYIDSPMCVSCHQNAAVMQRDGTALFCVHCTFVNRAEVEHGLRRLGEYLAHWARFRTWEEAHAHEHAPSH